MRKRMLSILLTLSVCLGMLPAAGIPALAAGETHTHCPHMGMGICWADGECDGEETLWTPLTQQDLSDSAYKLGGDTAVYYYLTEEIRADRTITIEGDEPVNLCFNGRDIVCTGSGDTAVSILDGGALVMTDCSERMRYSYWAGEEYVFVEDEDEIPTNTHFATHDGGILFGGVVRAEKEGDEDAFVLYAGSTPDDFLCKTCADEDGDHRCDRCRGYMEELCTDEDGDHSCDECEAHMGSLCGDGDDPYLHYCDVCHDYMYWLCGDGDGDHACDECGELMDWQCEDEDEDHFCDVCENHIQWVCFDEIRDHYCDICGSWLTECLDENGDHVCDICGEELDCEDANGDHLCDYCDERLSDCDDEDGDHFCDLCDQAVSDCLDEAPHDHMCDICGVYHILDQNHDGFCDVPGCELVDTSMQAEFTKIVYSQDLENDDWDILINGEIQVTVESMYVDQKEKLPTGTVTATWSWLDDEDEVVNASFSAQLSNTTATIEFEAVTWEGLDNCEITYTPDHETISFAPLRMDFGIENSGLPQLREKEIQEDIYSLINGVYQDLYLVPGSQVKLDLYMVIDTDRADWVFENADEEEVTPESLDAVAGEDGISVTITMPETDLIFKVEAEHPVCADENNDHWCDSILCEAEEPYVPFGVDENADKICDVCGNGLILTQFSDGSIKSYCDLAAALNSGAESLKMFGDDHMRTGFTVDESMVIDLNGHAMSADSISVLLVDECDITLTDTSEEGLGKLCTPTRCEHERGCMVGLYLFDSDVIIEAGTVSGCYAVVLDESVYGEEGVGSRLCLTGGKLNGTVADILFIKPRGDEVLHVADLSQCEDPAGMTMLAREGDYTLEVGEHILLPEGYELRDSRGRKLNALPGGEMATVRKIRTSSGKTPSQSETIPAEENKMEVQVSVKGSGASVSAVELPKQGEEVLIMDLSALNKNINTVELSDDVVEQLAQAAADPGKGVQGLEIVFGKGMSISFDADALEEVMEQSEGQDISISMKAGSETAAQKAVVGDRPAFDIRVSSGGKPVSKMGGKLSIQVPYTLKVNEDARGIVVYYVNEAGEMEACVTDYDKEKQLVSWITDHLSVYMIGYDETLTQSCPRDESCPMADFSDLARDVWYHNGVHYAIENGLMTGTGQTTFAPHGVTTRGQLVTILWSMENKPVVNAVMPFGDVAQDQWYTEAVRWAASEGIVVGNGSSFFPEEAVTREQLAAILWSYAKYKGCDVSVGEQTNILSYFDAFEISEYAIPAIQWACGAGIMDGVRGDRDNMYLRPQMGADRSQTAVMMMQLARALSEQ